MKQASVELPKGGRKVRLIPGGDPERRVRHAIYHPSGSYWWTKGGTWELNPKDEWEYEE